MAGPNPFDYSFMPDTLGDIVRIRTATGQLIDIGATQKALDGICFAMDDQGKELFMSWLKGSVSGTLLLETPQWQAYMREDESHRLGLAEALFDIAVALKVKLPVGSSPPHVEKFSTKAFPARVGKVGGGYYRGYEMLHGANMTVGGMQVKKGTLKAFSGPAPYTYTVTFREMDLEFNDITDPAGSNLADSAAAGFFTNLASLLSVGPPKDFTTTIRWRSDLEATVTVFSDQTCSIGWRKA